jgi:hypothetical protein
VHFAGDTHGFDIVQDANRLCSIIKMMKTRIILRRRQKTQTVMYFSRYIQVRAVIFGFHFVVHFFIGSAYLRFMDEIASMLVYFNSQPFEYQAHRRFSLRRRHDGAQLNIRSCASAVAHPHELTRSWSCVAPESWFDSVFGQEYTCHILKHVIAFTEIVCAFQLRVETTFFTLQWLHPKHTQFWTIEMDDVYLLVFSFLLFPSCPDFSVFRAARRKRRSSARRHSVRLNFEAISVGVRMHRNTELDFAWFCSRFSFDVPLF